MSSIGVRELRQHASRWLERVKGGESFEITVRGRAVARLVPVERRGLQALIEDGLARPASTPFAERLETLGSPPEGPSLSAELDRLRADEH